MNDSNKANTYTSNRSVSREDLTFRVLRSIEINREVTQRELARKLSVSVGGLNYCLKELIAKGLVKMQNFKHSKNKFGYVYILTPQGFAQKTNLTGHFLKRKIAEYEALKSEIESLQ